MSGRSSSQEEDSFSLKRLLGLERMSDKTLDRMCRSNMRLAKLATPFLALGVLIVFIVGMGILPADSTVFANRGTFAFLNVLMLAACIALNIGARRYEKGKFVNRKIAYIYLSVYILVSYAYAIALSAACFEQFGRMSIFYIFLIIASIFFVFNTILQVITTATALTAFTIVFHTLGIGDTMVSVSVGTVAVVVMIAGALRYDEACRSALSNVESDEASKTDILTGLKNRLAFDTEYPGLAGRELIVAMTDIDDFKYFNDAYSHETGDEVLRKFAGVLLESFPEAEVYRYGGDEFVIVMANPSEEADFRDDAGQFLANTANIRLEGNDNERITASLGYGQGRPRNAIELASLLHLSDRKLYEAKRSGKSRFVGAPLEKNDITRNSTLPGKLPLRRSYETDQLTGLPNMQFFRAHGLQFASHLRAARHEPVLVYFNLANFKLVNERRGYRAGDELLCETADAIQDSFPGMLLSLIAEDHFALVCARVGLEDGIFRARETVDGLKGEQGVVLKAGVCPVPEDADDIGGPYDSAKIACDSIKMSYGKDLRYYDEELAQRVQRRRYVLDNIHAAIRRGDIVVFYQPVYRSMTGRLSSSEALVRWKDERYGMISPADFIGLLEDTQQISELDGYVMARVCDDWKAMHDAGEPALPVSVNFSRVDFQVLDVASIVEENVRRVGMPRQMVHIEITESAFTKADEALSEQIERLRSLGYEVWMDDFGSGYSSLNQLKWHDFDLVKIDMAFLKHFEDDQVKTLLASIVDMIKRMGVQTLVEGVETKDQFEFMRAIGCEFIQGYYLSKPIDFASYRALATREAKTLEPFAMRGYYNAIGQVNLLSQTPFAFGEDQIAPEEAAKGSMALAIVERRDGDLRYLMKSRAFDRLLSTLGVDDRLQDPQSELDLEQSATRKHYLQFLDSVSQSDAVLSSDFIIKGHDCIARGRKIASYGDADAMLLSMEDRARDSHYALEDQLGIAMSYMNSLFDKVDVADAKAGTVRNVYDRSAENSGASDTERPTRAVAEERARTIVHPEDRARYLQLFDMETLEERLARSEHGYVSGIARMLSKDGSYTWKVLMLIPAQTDAGSFVVICRRDANFSLVDELEAQGDRIMDDLLWNAVLELIPEKVFWKDRDLRFLGANRPFLDYFGLASVGEILGKTDDDMGWHPDPRTYHGDELAVVKEGKSIVRSAGTCIAKGKPRNILASKTPLARDGVIHGLIGYFADIEDDAIGHEDELGALKRDELTGTLNRYGLEDGLAEFERAASSGGLDYGLVYLDIDCLRQMNGNFGRDFGDRVLIEVSAKLLGSLGPHVVVGRPRADEFVVLQQFPQGERTARLEALAELGKSARAAIASITRVDATPCKITASVGCCLRSELESAAGMVELAEDRMRDDRGSRDMAVNGGATPARMTLSDAARRVKILQEHFDIARLVDPSTCEAYELSEDGRSLRKSDVRCYVTWGCTRRCANCISARTLADQVPHAKYERVDGDLFYATSREVEVDGRLCSLETATALPFDAGAVNESHVRGEELSEEASRAQGRRYYDLDVRTYNRFYLDETLSHLRARQVAAIEAERDAMAGATGGGGQSFARDVARAIKAQVRRNDIIVHFSAGRFVVVFDASLPEDDFEGKLEEIREQIGAIPGASVRIGAVQRTGTVTELLQEARQALFRGRDESGVILVGE